MNNCNFGNFENKDSMNKVILLTGGNIGDRKKVLGQARLAIASTVGSILEQSPIIESTAWGFESEDAFLNQVLIIETSLSAIDILDTIQQIELDLGRTRKDVQWTSRIIDIDILFFNSEIIESERLSIPHKHIQDRRFTLFGLNTLIPEFEHPVLHKTIAALLQSCEDKSEVEVYNA
jgi:2-amino-4-hydroxy-6-hydroxymethyldihydropteridine diphosphokinase